MVLIRMIKRIFTSDNIRHSYSDVYLKLNAFLIGTKRIQYKYKVANG